MTEAEWLTATTPAPMLEFLRDVASDRKLRLLALSCCRLIPSELFDHRSRHGVETAERFTESETSNKEFSPAAIGAWQVIGYDYATNEVNDVVFASVPHEHAARACSALCSFVTHRKSFSCLNDVLVHTKSLIHPSTAYSPILALLQDIFGNPFRPVTVDPTWLTSDVVALAKGIYADRAFDRMPILADALQDAGCDNDDILNHFRDQDTTHVRGCWALDLVLGKE